MRGRITWYEWKLLFMIVFWYYVKKAWSIWELPLLYLWWRLGTVRTRIYLIVHQITRKEVEAEYKQQAARDKWTQYISSLPKEREVP